MFCRVSEAGFTPQRSSDSDFFLSSGTDGICDVSVLAERRTWIRTCRNKSGLNRVSVIVSVVQADRADIPWCYELYAIENVTMIITRANQNIRGASELMG